MRINISGCQNQCQILQKHQTGRMLGDLGLPDAQSHHRLCINNKNTQITFRYFSPPKCHSSLTSNISNQRQKSDQISNYYQSNESAIQQEISIFRQNIGAKVTHAPEETSDKFYNYKIQQVKNLTLDGYEQLHKKLLQRNLLNLENRNVRLRLISPSVQESRQKVYKPNQSYIKRVQINLKPSKQVQQKSAHNQLDKQNQKKAASFERQSILEQKNNSNRGKENLIIKLYEKNDSKHLSESKRSIRNSYITPRRKSGSNRKGITVYSTSTRKQSIPDDDHFIQTEHNVSVNNASTNPIEKQDVQLSAPKGKQRNFQNLSGNKKGRATLKERYGQQFVEQLKRNTEKTKKRVYSKSKLGCKENPIEKASRRKIKLEV